MHLCNCFTGFIFTDWHNITGKGIYCNDAVAIPFKKIMTLKIITTITNNF